MSGTFKPPGRPRIHASAAERQRAWRRANPEKYRAMLDRKRQQRRNAKLPAATHIEQSSINRTREDTYT